MYINSNDHDHAIHMIRDIGMISVFRPPLDLSTCLPMRSLERSGRTVRTLYDN